MNSVLANFKFKLTSFCFNVILQIAFDIAKTKATLHI